MFFSGKITNSTLLYLEKQGVSLDALLERTDLPEEFLRDATCWLDASKVEHFLTLALEEFHRSDPDLQREIPQEPFYVRIGHGSRDLKGWGVLDSVLKMMGRPQDILAQPERFLSYFVSPAPPIGNIERDNDEICFEIPINSKQFPLFADYLKGAFEGLPQLVDQPLASAKWAGTVMRLSWTQNQAQLFSQNEYSSNLKPELVQNLVLSLEKAQRELEQTKQQLTIQQEELDRLKALQTVSSPSLNPLRESLNEVYQGVQRLCDYNVRAQQLITLFSGLERAHRGMEQAFRKTDWPRVQEEFPRVAQALRSRIKSLQTLFEGGSGSLDVNKKSMTSEKPKLNSTPLDLNEIVRASVERIQKQRRPPVQVDQILFLDRPARIERESFERAFEEILVKVISGSEEGDWVRVITRPKGLRAEVEVTAPGSLQGLENELDGARELLKNMEGELHFLSGSAKGSAWVVNLPL